MSARNKVPQGGRIRSDGTAANSKERKTITDEQIFNEIYDAIVGGRLPPGARLGQDELGEIFGVSKTRIRPVLHLLAQQKIVVMEPMRGAFVARPSVAEARAVNVARQVIEEGVIRAATRIATPSQIARLRENVEEERQARIRGETALAHQLTGQFHCELAEMTSNDVLVDVVRDLISRDSIVVALYLPPNTVGCSIADHIELIDAIESGDENLSANCMQKHLQTVMDSLVLEEVAENIRPVQAAFQHLAKRQ